MSSADDDRYGKAVGLQLTGRLTEAEQLYRAILGDQPRHAGANHCLGMIQVQLRRPADGLPYLSAALEANPQSADYWLGYLEALLLTGQIDHARETLALATKHGLAGAASNDFARRLAAQSESPATREESPVSASRNPPVPSSNAPGATRADRRRDERLANRQEAALLSAVAQGHFAEARELARAATEQFPERGLGWKILGAMLWADHRKEDALAAMQTSARLMPQDAEVHSNLGATLVTLNRFDEAEGYLRQALQIDPGFAAAHAHLGNAYQLQGRYVEAEASLRSAVSLRPARARSNADLRHSSLLFMLSHNPSMDADQLFAEHCRIGDALESALRASWPKHPNDPDPYRRLEVGFVSGDLCNHAVAHFIEPVLAELARFPTLRLHAYYNNTIDDEVSQRLRTYFTEWQPVSGLSDRELAKKILADRIDVLIDLSGHTSLNRLATFARKPAPIQVSWIGYPGTTGMRAMDYYLADRHFLPPGEFDRHFREKLVFLPANVPFQPHAAAPPVGPLPALATRALTFGSFNRLGKITPATVKSWSTLLRALPNSRLVIGGIPAQGGQAALLAQLRAAGIGPERLTFHLRCNMDEYLVHHHGVDICLDTSPYSGGTTTIHALWMGVPTLTIAGSTPASRQGAAILGQLGLDEFVARDDGDFAAKGCHWAAHLEELAQVRAGLRDRWRQSPARHADVIAGGLEYALRRMWSRWSAGLPAESFHAARFADEKDARA